MFHVKSSIDFSTKIPAFEIPKTQAEFDALTLNQKTALLEKHPTVYHQYVKRVEKKLWENP